jgi:2-haloacid dehalogenase
MRGWLLFDVNGTLTDPAALGSLWDRPRLGEEVLRLAVHTAMVETLTQTVSVHPFSEHVRAGIETLTAEHGLDRTLVEQAVGAAAALPARPGADEALARLSEAAWRLAALTNSGANAGRATLERAGLAARFDLVLGVDAVSRFKPHPEVYAYALEQLAVPASEVMLIATHPWDLAGAAAGGLRTAWVRHGALGWPAVFPLPEIEADTLPEVARALV